MLEGDLEVQEKERERVLADKEWDVLDYNFMRMNRAANGGRSSTSFRRPQAERVSELGTNPEERLCDHVQEGLAFRAYV